MTTFLLYSLTLHTYSAALAGVFFYLILLNSMSKFGISVRKMKAQSFLALIFSFLTWGSAAVLLKLYFSGDLGYTTAVSVTAHIPTFFTLQNILLPVIALTGALLFYVIRKKEEILEKGDTNSLIVVSFFSFLGFVIASSLMFLGVLLP